LIYADPDNVTYDALDFYKGFARTFLNASTPLSINQRLLKDGAKDLKEILTRWKPWIPPKLEQGLQQGAARHQHSGTIMILVLVKRRSSKPVVKIGRRSERMSIIVMLVMRWRIARRLVMVVEIVAEGLVVVAMAIMTPKRTVVITSA
jgi:hypothetical protein